MVPISRSEVERGRRDPLGVRDLDELAAPLRERLDHALPRRCLDAGPPVVAVDDEVGPSTAQVRLVVERLLRRRRARRP